MTTEEIYEHYREIVSEHLPENGYILKTDAFNEAEGGYKGIPLPRERTTYLEVDPATVAMARSRHPDRYFVQGDIREIASSDGVFSVVFDLSTIDHIPPGDVHLALDEYRRVLAKGGKLVMVAWCSDEWRQEPEDWGGPQYFLHEPELRRDVRARFRLVRFEEFHRSGEVYLVELIGEKIW